MIICRKKRIIKSSIIILRFKDGAPLQSSENVLIETKNKVINTMSIKSMSLENSGNYTVRAKNELGQTDCSFVLKTDGSFINF